MNGTSWTESTDLWQQQETAMFTGAEQEQPALQV